VWVRQVIEEIQDHMVPSFFDYKCRFEDFMFSKKKIVLQIPFLVLRAAIEGKLLANPLEFCEGTKECEQGRITPNGTIISWKGEETINCVFIEQKQGDYRVVLMIESLWTRLVIRSSPGIFVRETSKIEVLNHIFPPRFKIYWGIRGGWAKPFCVYESNGDGEQVTIEHHFVDMETCNFKVMSKRSHLFKIFSLGLSL
jgi:hypothetical protein